MGLNREIQHLAKKLNDKLGMLKFPDHVACVYNTFDYAFGGYAAYTNKFVQDPKKILFLGMNPGPWGMVQTGVPFGEVAAVRDWMGLHVEIRKPQPEHPKRPVEGLDCVRSEVSGRRLWGYLVIALIRHRLFSRTILLRTIARWPLWRLGAAT